MVETASPNTKNKSHSITAEIEIKKNDDKGVIIASGGISAGFVLYVYKGKLIYDYNYFGEKHYIITSKESLPIGKSKVKFDFKYDGGGTGKGGMATLYINDKKAGEGRIEQTVAARFGLDTFGIGEDTGAPVTDNYKSPFKFTGQIKRVDIELK